MPVTIDELSNMASFGGGGQRRSEVTLLPDPEPPRGPAHRDLRRRPRRRAAAHVRRTVPRQARRRTRPGSSTPTTAASAWVWDGETHPNVGFNAVAGRPIERVRLRADPLRRDAPRRVGHRRPRPRHGPQRGVRVAVLPVVPARLRRPALSARADGPRARAGRDAGLERLASRGVGGTHPDRIIPLQLPWLLDPEVAAAEIRRNAERGFKAVTFSESARQARAPVAPHRLLGPVPRRLRGDRRPSSASTSARRATSPIDVGGRAARDDRRALLRVRDVRRRRLAVLEDPGPIPRHQDLPVGGRDRLGRRRSWTGSTTCFDYQMGTCGTWEGIDLTPAEVLRRNFWFCAIDDELGVGHASPDRRRPHPRRRVRLPARRLDLARHAGRLGPTARRDARRRGAARHAGRTPPRCSAIRSRPRRGPNPKRARSAPLCADLAGTSTGRRGRR